MTENTPSAEGEIAPAAVMTTTVSSGGIVSEESSPAFAIGSVPITWVAEINSFYSAPSSDWTAYAGNMASVIAAVGGNTTFTDPPLVALDAPESYATLAIGGVYSDSISGTGASDEISCAFSASVPAGSTFLLWDPGANEGETGPYTFEITAFLNGASVSMTGWSVSIESPSNSENSGSYSFNPSSGKLTVGDYPSDAGFPDAIVSITPDSQIDEISVAASTTSYDTWGLAIPTGVPCYCAGSLIRTETGEAPVESLAIGSRVITHSGAVRPVKWIGTRSYAGRFLAANPGAQPIRFRGGSLGDGLPRRDLLVSPEHAMFIDGLLIPARCLVNGSSVVQERGLERVDYFHVELESHDVLLAEGAPSESYLDDDSRGLFHNASEFPALYPDAIVSGRFCAPRIEDGYKLEVILERLLHLAQAAA